MDYKVGDKIEFILGGVVLKGEILSIKKWPFKKYRVAYKNANISFFQTYAVWIKARDVVGLDNGEPVQGRVNIKPPVIEE